MAKYAVTRTSPMTGKETTIYVEATNQNIKDWEAGNKLIQECFPDLTPAEREFIITGYTQEDWDLMFKDAEE